MSSEWPSSNLGSSTFDDLQASLMIGMIATLRGALKTCNCGDTIANVVAANKADQFDYLPVVLEHDTILGMFLAHAHSDSQSLESVSAHMKVLAERHLDGADTSILEFVEQADKRPCRLIVAGGGFTGLVALSDLQKLPVRAALFAAITAFEMTMALAIRHRFAGADGWKALLSDGRRSKIQ